MISSIDTVLHTKGSFSEWQSRNREQAVDNTYVKQTTRKPTKLRTLLTKSNKASSENLSKLVWERNHVDLETKQNISKTSKSRPSPKIVKPSVSSGRQSSYELELINRRLNILGDGFLDSGDGPWAPIEVTISPASSDLLGPELSDCSSSELDIPHSARKNKFVSLRGLSGIKKAKRSNASKHPVTVTTDLPTTDVGPLFFVTDQELEENQQFNASTTFCNFPEDFNMTTRRVIQISPWETKKEEGASCDKSTSPYLEEDGNELMTTSIRIFQNQSGSSRAKETPKYPFETGQSKNRKPSRSSIHNGLLRSHRLQDFSHPSVVSSTQQLLCLTPSRGGVITLGSNEDVKHLVKPTESNSATVQVKRFNENEKAVSRPQFSTIVTKTTGGERNTAYRLMQRDGSSKSRTSTIQGHPFALTNLHYKHTTQIQKPYRYSAPPAATGSRKKLDDGATKTPTIERNATAMSMTKHPASTAYRIIESHVKWNRKPSGLPSEDISLAYPYHPSFTLHSSATQARKMAPVLRVIPALPLTAKPTSSAKPPKSPIDTEPTSQKKVRFSDQIGLPLVRNATPNYRRKHSYILRWLESAGRPAKSIPLA